MFSGLAFRIIASLVGVAVLAGGVFWVYNHIEGIGYDRAHTEQLEQAIRKSEEGRQLRARPLTPDQRNCLLLPRGECHD